MRQTGVKPLRYAPVAALAALLAAGCSAASTAHTAAAGPSATPAAPSPHPSAAASPSQAAVAAVPGTSNNQYVAGPFTVTLRGLGQLPEQYDSVTESGQTIPQTCAVVDVKNTSSGFTGWVAPQVEFVKGHTLAGQVLDTEPADPSGGSDGGESSALAPGQSQRLYACPQRIATRTYVEAQLISVAYGTPGQGTISATVVRLKY